MDEPVSTEQLGEPTTLDEKTANHPDEADAAKRQAIVEACKHSDLCALRALAESPGGFLTDDLRQQAWPILLGASPEPDAGADASSWESLPRHRDEDQVQLDVNRAFIYYPENQTDAQLALHKSALSDLIVSVLRRHPYLCYFQGYHDIAQVLLLVLQPPLQLPCLTHLSLLRIRDFMLPSLSPAVAQLRLLPDLLARADPPLGRHLARTEPFFALAGTLTMYAHDVPSLASIARLFDAMLARDPAFSVYLFAALARARRAELFAHPPDEAEVLHSILAKLPARPPLDLEALIADAARMRERVPPESLPAWRGISRWSVLKTAAAAARRAEEGRGNGGGGVGPRSVEDGRALFERQVAELRWEEKKEAARKWVWRHRRPARTIAIAVVVGVLAVVLRRSQAPAPLLSGLGYVSGLLARWWR